MNFFADEINCEDLIWKLRQRHQMWAGDKISQLYGVIVGFALSRKEFDFEYMHRLKSFVEEDLSLPRGSRSLPEIVEDLAGDANSENCVFFELFERFSGAKQSHIEKFHVTRKDSNLRLVGGVRDPAFVELVEFSGRGVYLFFLNKSERRFYEMGMESFTYGIEFINREFLVSRPNCPVQIVPSNDR